MHAVPEPFVAYLRVYEPLSSFSSPLREQLARAAEDKPLDLFDAGRLEQQVWLRNQLALPPRLLPEDRDEVPDVLVLDPSEVPAGPDAVSGPGPLVCPLDLRGRSAAALVGFLGAAEPSLRASVLPVPADRAKSRAQAVISELSGAPVHVLSSTWTVPLPWFTAVDPAERRVLQRDGQRRVCWRTTMTEAQRRVVRAHAVCERSIGESGPTRLLLELSRWLEQFHSHAAVELDYGGLTQMMSDSDLDADSSAEDVHAIIDAMELADSAEVAARYEALRDYWAEFAAREHHN